VSRYQYLIDDANDMIPIRGSQMTAQGIVDNAAFIYKYVETHGMTKLLDNFRDLLLPASYLLESMKDKYPKEADKIKLWQKLHGV